MADLIRATARTRLWVALTLGATLASGASTYYVSPSGSNSNPGTAELPFQTLQAAVDAAGPGDTIEVQDGVYPPPASAGCSGGRGYALNLTKGGAPGAPIVLKAARKWGAVLDAASMCHSYIYLWGGANYWVIEGFVVTRGYWMGIGSNSGASNVTIRGNRFEDIGRREEYARYGIAGTYANADSHDIVIDGNVFRDIGRIAGIHPFNDHGLYLHSRNSLIINNVFHHPISGWGIQTSYGFSGVIANNTFHGPHSSREGQLMLWDLNGDVVIRNNIFYEPRGQAITSYAFSLAANASCKVEHNIVFGSGVTLGAPSSCSTSANMSETDPKLVNATQPPYDFRLRPESPAIGAGVAIPGATVDFEGTPRANPPCIGAYERIPLRPPRQTITLPPRGPGQDR